MPEYADLYILSKHRTRAAADAFLDRFLPHREESAVDYHVPRPATAPAIVFHRAADLIEHCCDHPATAHSIYWQATTGDTPGHAMIFFLSDGYVIYGLSTAAAEEGVTRSLLDDLKRHFHSDDALLRHEEAPPHSAAAFHAAMRRHS